MTACEISPLVDEAARAAVLVVDRNVTGVAPNGSGAASKVVLHGLDVFISYHREDEFRAKIDFLEHYLRTALKSFTNLKSMPECVFDTSFPQLLVQSKQQHWFHFNFHGEPDYPLGTHFDSAPLDRGLMTCKYQLPLAAKTWSDHDCYAVWEIEHCQPQRHLLIGQTGDTDNPRDYLVIVQNAPLSKPRCFDPWTNQTKPAVLRLPGRYDGLREHSDATRKALQEYLLCVVPLDEQRFAAKETIGRSINLRCHALTPAAEQSHGALDEGTEDDTTWLSLTHYAEIFLGDGARKRVLDAHLQGRRKASGKEQADPGKA